jgi:TfoX/Sxy family transcriptional regulator of competence genes
MAFDEKLRDRTREIISKTHKITEEKKMFGGLCFMVNDKIRVGIMKDEMMVQLDPEVYDKVLDMDGCHSMDFSGKPMRGFVFVDSSELSTQKKLNYWVQLALDFNKVAKASKKK